MAGRLITLEGGEGTGKSTQAVLLARRLQDFDLEVVVTREPGGTPMADGVRALLLDAKVARSSLAEALLFNAARADHLEHLIRPALSRGRWVVCDRFADSTRAYQGAADGVPAKTLARLEKLVLGATRPDLTLILDLDAKEGLARARTRRASASGRSRAAAVADAFEARALAFHERLRAGYLAIARAEPGRCVLIDASGAPEEVARRIEAVVAERLCLPALRRSP